ncbi:unnamed protein product [Urochloa humidicola]
MPPPTRPQRARPQLAAEGERRPQALSAKEEVRPELSFPQGHLPSSARSSCRRGSTPTGRPRRAVPDTGAPPAVFNIGDDAPSAVSNTGIDILYQATTGCSNVRHCQKFLTLETNKRPWSRSSTPSEGGTEEEGDGSGRSETPDSTQPRPEKRPIGRNKEKEKSRAEDKKLKEERWKEEKKLKEERWKETRMLQEKKISLEREMFLWEQEQRIMFCDLNTLDPTQKTYVVAMRAQIAEQKMAAFNGKFSSDGFSAPSNSGGGDVDGAAP